MTWNLRLRPRRGASGGFNLIEVLISVFLLAMAVLFVFSVFPQARQSAELHANHARAAYVARQLLQELTGTPFSAIASGSGDRTFNFTSDGQPASLTIHYEVNVQNQDIDKKLVWIVLTWDEQGRQRRLVVETLMVNPRRNPSP
ncbi:MAG TPA: hypothetical protein VNO81_02195 [Candidatus Nitrosotenuis sp.]|nr:hypothetical protein [Candidatus Nitrosotenuis sp.]